ncbi:uncharacterized protein DSM5745_05265 [Aspergillus mulundensis]|uniref:PX domain-containing protein n=1 Tax=Aspergillus mulundensis TaxID=1810919 RepID=A0A3D8S606_9EURO|nr:Uncharacterized protein DSM5745_05265 [Aspergillus mulundensis]RDW81708.1 Uncharacterized protein DSM5745_05265 [Aspergillus mulundensis]
MAPANEETGRVPRPQPLPASPHPSNAAPSALDRDGDTVEPAISNPAETSADPSPASSSHFQSESPSLAPKERPVSGIVPPYWSHHRNASRVSQISTDGGPAITLEDHTEDPNSETSRGLWAKSVTIDDHVVVQGKTGIGAYVVWNCKIRTLEIFRVRRPPTKASEILPAREERPPITPTKECPLYASSTL